MPTVSHEVLAFAKDQFREVVKDLLDDPSSLLHPDRDLEPAEELACLRRLGTDLGLRFDDLVNEGHEISRDRLAKIEAGEIKPATRYSET